MYTSTYPEGQIVVMTYIHCIGWFHESYMGDSHGRSLQNTSRQEHKLFTNTGDTYRDGVTVAGPRLHGLRSKPVILGHERA